MVRRIVNPATHQPFPVAKTKSFADGTWAFVLEPLGDGQTRLVQRFRFDARPRPWAGILYAARVEIPHFVMEQAMMRGIKARAERVRALPH